MHVNKQCALAISDDSVRPVGPSGFVTGNLEDKGMFVFDMFGVVGNYGNWMQPAINNYWNNFSVITRKNIENWIANK